MTRTENAKRGQAVESTALTTRTDTTRELQVSHQQASARYEIEGAIILARQFPRNEDAAYQGLMQACKRESFAESVSYRFPRGDKSVEGPSIYLARELGRLWGNIRYGLDIVADDDEERTIRAWAWDLETNARVSADDSFKKLIYRKNGGWQKPDERDLRELTNRRGAILVRNCLLGILPSDFVDDAVKAAKQTLEKGAADNIEDSRKKIVVAYGGIGVSVDELEKYLGHPIASCSPAEIANLRQVWKSINDGQSQWSDYAAKAERHDQQPGDNSGVSASDLTGGKASKTTRKPQEKPEESNPYTAEFADCKTLDAVLERHALLMSGPDAETDGTQIEAAAQARRAQIGGK